MPGALEVTDLHHVSATSSGNISSVAPTAGLSTNTGVMDLGHANLDIATPKGLVINTAENTIDIVADGRYLLQLGGYAANGLTPSIEVNGNIVVKTGAALPPFAEFSIETIQNLLAGDRIEFGTVATRTILVRPHFNIQQLATKTVINTTDIPVSQAGIVEGDVYEADGNGGLRKATPKFDQQVGIWTGNFALSSGHQTLNVGFDITECDYLDLTLYDDGASPWTWSGRIEGRSIEINSSNILVDRNGSSYVWARTAGVNPALGQIQFRDEGGVAQNIGQVVGYKRATL